MLSHTGERISHLHPGFCLECGETRVDVSSRYEDGYCCGGLGNGDEGCGSKRVFLEESDYVEALEQAYADRHVEAKKLLTKWIDFAKSGASIVGTALEAEVASYTFASEADRDLMEMVVKLVTAERAAARPKRLRPQQLRAGGAP